MLFFTKTGDVMGGFYTVFCDARKCIRRKTLHTGIKKCKGCPHATIVYNEEKIVKCVNCGREMVVGWDGILFGDEYWCGNCLEAKMEK